jgi:MATE family multidrug resistance protein
MRLLPIFLIAYGLNVIAKGMLQGIQDISFPLPINILIQWFIGMSSAYLLCFKINWGNIGLWLGFIIGTTLGTTFLFYRFYFSIYELIKSSDLEKALDSKILIDDSNHVVLKSFS